MADKIRYGLSSLFYAVASDSGSGVLTYGTPVELKGAVSLNLEQQGEQSIFYADNIEYFVSNSNNGYQGTLEVALLPEAFRTSVLGETADSNGVVVEKADQVSKEFALLFQFEGDEHAIKHCLYRCKASRPAVNGSTKEGNIDPQTETINITAVPRISDHVVKARCLSTSTAAYSAWYTAVYTVSM